MVEYNGKDLSDFFVNAVGRGTYGAPARDVEVVHVPGRNGDIIFDNGNYQNQTITYPECSILAEFPVNFRALINFLSADAAYHVLRDSYHPGEYRLARFAGPIEPDVHTPRGNRSGTFDLTFDVMPQRFLDAGARWYDVPYARRESGVSKMRLFVDNTYGARTINIKTRGTATVTLKYNSQTMTAAGPECTFEIPQTTTYYFDVETSEYIAAVSVDGVETVFTLDNHGTAIYTTFAVIDNPTSQIARPEWRFMCGDDTALYTDATLYVDQPGGLWNDGGMKVQFNYDKQDKSIVVNTENMICYAEQRTGSSIRDTTVSGTIPLLQPGKNYIRIEAGNPLVRVRMKPGFFEV